MDDRVSQSAGVGETKLITGNPLVSIITPVLNGIKYLETCIQSVLSQSYPYIEHIFIDGGSTDGTLDILSSYQARYPDRIRFISEPDRGVGEALNKGLKMAKGEIFGWFDSDDVLEADAIMMVVNFFRSNPEAYFVFGESNVINEKGEVIRKVPIKDFNLKEAINDRHHIHFTSAFYKREVIERVGGFNTLGNDLDFWIRVGKVFPMHRIEKTLSNWRLHGDTVSASREVNKRRMVRQRFREDYLLCRQNGGSIFAPRVRRYFIFLVLDRLRLYLFVNYVVLPKLRRFPFINRVLRILGA
jgi:glycosyltransferase involved in cell wall biosynthesis